MYNQLEKKIAHEMESGILLGIANSAKVSYAVLDR